MATINLSEQNNTRIIEVIGRLDGDTAPEMGVLLDQALDTGHVRLVLDLGSVDYISSAGLREIVRVFKRAQAQGGDLRIANPSDPVMTVMELAGLDTALNIYQTRTEAVQSFAA
jgi:anti-sigma B factor antagonist